MKKLQAVLVAASLLVAERMAWAEEAASAAPLRTGQKWAAFWISLGILGLFIVVPFVNWLVSPARYVTVYRPYEERFLKNGVFPLEGLLAYHAQYHWGHYAAVCIGMALLSLNLLLTDAVRLSGVDLLIQEFSAGLMTVASVLLVWADLVHTNSQTPLVPLGRRFKLIGLSVRLGTVGTMLIVVAVLMLVGLMTIWGTIAGSVVFLFALVYSTWCRMIEKQELYDHFARRIANGTDFPEEDMAYIRKAKAGQGEPVPPVSPTLPAGGEPQR